MITKESKDSKGNQIRKAMEKNGLGKFREDQKDSGRKQGKKSKETSSKDMENSIIIKNKKDQRKKDKKL